MSRIVICKPIQAEVKYLSATSRNVFLKDKHGFKLTIICVVENSNACLETEEDESKREIKAGELLVTILSAPGTESTNNRSGSGQVFC